MAEKIALARYNNVMYRRLIAAIKIEYGFTIATKDRRGDYIGQAYDSTRTIAYKLRGLNPKTIASMRANQATFTRYLKLSEKRPIRFEEPGNGILTIEVPKLGYHWKQVTVDSLIERRRLRPGSLSIPFGLGPQDRVISADFSKPTFGNLGVFGITQSGKTNSLKYCVWFLIMTGQADMILVDIGMKSKNFGVFNGASALLHPLVHDPAEAYDLLVWLKSEIARRASNMGANHKPLFVVVDETQTLIDYTTPYGDSSSLLSDIARMGIQVGVRVILATQYPQIQFIGQAKRNLGLRLCHKVDEAQSSTNALGVKNQGAEGLLGYGDGLFKDNNGVYRLSVARLDEIKDAGHYNRIERGGYRSLPLATVTNEDAAPDIPEPKQAHPSQVPDDLEPSQLAYAVLTGDGENKIKRRFRVGSKKAKRIVEAANEFRAYAYHHDLKCLPEPTSKIIEAVEGKNYGWLTADWTEV